MTLDSRYSRVPSTYHRRRHPTPLTITDGRVGGQDPLRQQQLHGLPSVPDRPFPVLKQVVCMPPLSYSTNWPYLSSLPPTNVLELIGCEPGPLEPDTGPLAPLAQPGQEPGQHGEDL